MPLPPLFLEQVRGLVALARLPVRGATAGHHRSRRIGGGSEFAEHRAYAPGDDPRHLDWKALERTGRYLVKRYHSDRRCDVQLIVDRSGSMGFGTTADLPPASWGPWPASKWQAAHMLALALALIFLRQGDRVGLTVADGRGLSSLPPRGGESRFTQLSAQVLGEEPTGSADLGAALAAIASSRERPLVVLFSDLLADEDCVETLALHAARGSETWLLHLVDPAELSFPYEEPTRFVCLEGGGDLSLNPRELGRLYRAEFSAFVDRQREGCLDSGIQYAQVRTDEPLQRVLARFLAE
jgi:uncharacterized protein (DUF58 family)